MEKLKCYFGYHKYNKWWKIGGFLNKKGLLAIRKCDCCGYLQEKVFPEKYKMIYPINNRSIVNNLRMD